MTENPGVNPVYEGSRYATPPPPKPSYWENPVNVEKFHQLARFTPPDQIPEWFNAGAIEEAHNYYSSLPQNANKEWWNYTAPENDEMAPIMAEIPPPPKDILGGYEKYQSNYTNDDFYQFMAAKESDPSGQAIMLDKSEIAQLPQNIQQMIVGSLGDRERYAVPGTMMQQIQSMVPQEKVVPNASEYITQLKSSGQWDTLPAYDKLMLSVQNTGAPGAAMGTLQGLIPAAVMLAGRNPVGAATALGMGAGLGQLASGEQDSPWTQAGNFMLNMFNAGAETITRMTGMLGQFAGSAMAPEWYGPLSELMQSLPEAWQASDIAYAAAHPFTNSINTRVLGGENKLIQGEEADALLTITKLRRELQDVYAGRSPKTLEEVLYGYKDAQVIVDKYWAKYGIQGQNRDLAFQILADPLNFVGGTATLKMSEDVAKSLKMPKLATWFNAGRYTQGFGKAFTGSIDIAKKEGLLAMSSAPEFTGGANTGPVTKFREYLNQVRTNPSEYTEAQRLDKWLNVTGVDWSESKPKLYTDAYAAQSRAARPVNPVKAIPWWLAKSPETNVTDSLINIADSSKSIYFHDGVSVDDSIKFATALATADPKITAAAGIGIDGNPALWMGKDAFNGVENKLSAFSDNYHQTQESRDLVSMIAGDSKSFKENAHPEDIMKAVKDDPQKYLDLAIENLRKSQEPDAQAKLKFLEQLDPQRVKDSATILVDTKAPLTKNHAKAQITNIMLDSVKEWGIKRFGVQEQGGLRKINDAMKTIESFLLLFPNPAFAIQNVMNNSGSLFADGLAGSAFSNDHRFEFWEKMGWSPERRQSGIGDTSRVAEVSHGELSAKTIGEVQKLRKGKSVNTNMEQGMTAIKKFFKGGMPAASNKNEMWASDVAFTAATENALRQFNRMVDPMDANGVRALEGVGQVPDRIQAAVHGSVNSKEVMSKLGKEQINFTPSAELEASAKDFGMYDALEKAYKSENPDEIRKAVNEVLLAKDGELSASEVAGLEREALTNAEVIMKGEGEQKILTLKQDMDSRMIEAELEHNQILERVNDVASKMDVKKASKYLGEQNAAEDKRMQRTIAMYEANAKGTVKGMGLDPETTGIANDLHASVMNLKRFYSERFGLWNLFSKYLGGDEKAVPELQTKLKKLLGDKYVENADLAPQTRQAITEMYKGMLADNEKINDSMNAKFLDHVLAHEPEGYNGFKDYVALQKTNRKLTSGAELYFRTGEDILSEIGDQGKAVKKQIDDMLGKLTLDEYRASSRTDYKEKWDRFQKEVYTPLWMQGLSDERIAERKAWKEGRGMLPSEPPKVEAVEPVNRFDPIDRTIDSTDKEELVAVGKLYGFANGVSIQKFVNKHLGNELSWKKGEITPQILKDALATLPEDELVRRWVGEVSPEVAPVTSPNPDVASSKLTPPVISAQGDSFGNLKKMVLDYTEEHITKPNKVFKGGIFDEIDAGAGTPAQKKAAKNAVIAYVSQLDKQMKDNAWKATRIGMQARDFTLLNYNNQTRLDQLLNMAFPYHYWYTHSMLNWAVRALDRPAMMASYAKMKLYLDNLQQDPATPARLKGKLKIPLPFLPDFMGDAIYVDPMRNVIPIDNFLRPFDQWDQDATQRNKTAVGILQDMVENEKITFDEAEKAAQTKSGELWNSAYAQAGTQLDSPSAVDYATMLMSPHMPYQWIYKAATGQASSISQLPFTRMVQNVTGGLGLATENDMFGGLIGPQGVNLEAWARKPLGLPMIDKFQDYRIDRMLSVMASENPEMTDELTKAMIDREGELYNEAASRVMQTNLQRWNFSTMAGDFMPEGELDQRKLKTEYAKASEKYAGGDKTALNGFFEEHPEYAVQQAVWREPEQRMRMYLKSQLWDAYRALPDLYKKEVAASFGTLFQDAFLDTQTRSYDSIPTNTMASWLNALNDSAVPGTAETSVMPMNLSSPQDAQLVQGFNDYTKQNFPNLDKIYEYANSLPADQRDQFLNSQQEVAGFNQIKNSFLAQYPNLADSVNSQSNELMGLPTNIQGAVYGYRDEKAKMFPNIEDIQTQYFSLTDPVQKSAFMLDHPELEKYWNWRGSYAANFPNASPYILSDQNIKGALSGTDFNAEQAFPGIYDTQSEYFSYAKGSPARRLFLSQHPELKLYWDWKGYYGDELKAEAAFAKEISPIIAQMSDELKSNMVGHFSAGQSISSGAMMELKKLYNLNGMGGGLNTFIESLKVGF